MFHSLGARCGMIDELWMSYVLLCHLLSFNDLDHYIPSIDSVPVVNEFQDVFHDDFPGVPPPSRD